MRGVRKKKEEKKTSEREELNLKRCATADRVDERGLCFLRAGRDEGGEDDGGARRACSELPGKRRIEREESLCAANVSKSRLWRLFVRSEAVKSSFHQEQ